MAKAMQADGSTDFDFLHGSWTVRHHRLERRLVGSQSWADFGGTVEVRSILGGLGNFDENIIDLPDGRYVASTIRIYNQISGTWSIFWIDGRDPKLDPPMIGTFEDGTGAFLGDDTYDGRPIKVRFLWTTNHADGPQWEQAFSEDDGETWETNWIMKFIRA